MRTQKEIENVINDLSAYKRVAVKLTDKEICNAQIDVLRGIKKVSDFDGYKKDFKKAVRAASDWMLGEILYESALFE